MRDGFPGGLATGCIATLVSLWFFDPRLGPVLEGEAASFFAIGATLAAAAVAYAGILRQIGHQRLLEEDRRQGELEAERAALPLALARICEISEQGMQELFDHRDLTGKLVTAGMKLEETHTETIKAMIKVSPSPVRVRLQAILRGYQVAMASVDWDLRDDVMKVPAKQSADGITKIALCYRWAMVYAIAESLFNFSRGDTAPLVNQHLASQILPATQKAGITPAFYTGFEDAFRRKTCGTDFDHLEKLFVRENDERVETRK